MPTTPAYWLKITIESSTCKAAYPVKSDLSISSRHSAGHWLAWGAFAAIVAAYILCQVSGFSPAYAETDPDAYLFLAKRMALGQPLAVNTTDPFQYQHHMWVEAAPGQVTSKYPPGYPALMAIAYRLAGDRGMFMVSPIMGGLALIGAGLLFRLWLKPFSAVMALFTLALLPEYSFYCAYLLSHATSLCLTTWGMYFLWRWLAQPKPGWGLAAGAALGATVTVRPTDALFVLPLVVVAAAGLWKGYRAGRMPWLAVTAMMGAWGVFVGLLAFYNYTQFGGLTVTGYALSGEQGGFSLDYFINHFGRLTVLLPRNFLPVFFPLSLVGLLLWGPPVDRAVRLLWFFSIFITYTSYYWVTENWAWLRFLMSTLPVCIGSAYAMVDQFPASRAVRTGTILVLVSLFSSLNFAGLQNQVQGKPIGQNPQALAQAAEQLALHIPSNAVIFSQAPMCYSMGQRAAYTLYELEAFNQNQGLDRFKTTHTQRAETEPRRQPGRTLRMRAFYEKTTNTELQNSKRMIIDSNLKAGQALVFFIPVRQYETEKQILGEKYQWKTLAEWDVDREWSGRQGTLRWGLYSIGFKG